MKMSKRSSKSKSKARPASFKRVQPFPYRAIQAPKKGKPPPPLRPLLPIVVHTAKAHIPLYALVDSGADYSIFPSYYARHFGIDLDKCREEPCVTAAGEGKVKIHDIPLEAEIQAMRMRFAMTAAFNEHAVVVLLGRTDFFKEFYVEFDERAETFTLRKYA